MNPFCQIDLNSPLCQFPVTDEVSLLLIQKAWLENAILNPNWGQYAGLFSYYIALINQRLARTDCTPPKNQVKCPCLQPGAVFDKNGSLELQTLNRTLIERYGITQGIFTKPMECVLYFFTPVIVYSVTFSVNGAKFQIKRCYKNELKWVLVMLSGYLSETTGSIRLFAPFLDESQIPQYWAGVKIPDA